MDACSYTNPAFRSILSDLHLKTMLEIGSLHGLDAIEVLNSYGLERVITIECNPECIEICRRNFAPFPNITLVEVAAWHSDGTIPFFRVTESSDRNGVATRNIGASSCFKSNDQWPFEKYKQERIDVPARRLEGVLRELKVSDVDLICMDAQGAELYALQGLGPYLDRVQAIVTELELKPMYHGQTLFEDVQLFLRQKGFSLVAENRWAETAGDFLFVREGAVRKSRPISVLGDNKFSNRGAKFSSATDRLTVDDVALACKVARSQWGAGQLRAARTTLAAAAEACPESHLPHVMAGQLSEHVRDFHGAVRAYERASELNPGYALPFSRRAMLKLRLEIGNPPVPRPFDANRPFVTINSLGANGRFGNQLLQYGVTRVYAERFGLQLAVPDWIGRDLFGLADPLAAHARPAAAADEALVTKLLAEANATSQRNIDVSGFFCGEVTEWASGRAEFQRCFEPVGKVKSRSDAALRQIRARGDTIVAVHIRRGDYGQGRFWVAPIEWYTHWLKENWQRLARPVLYVASDDQRVFEAFGDYAPMTAADLGSPLPGVEFFADHWIMRNADWLLTSNSTFSGTAALLNRKAAARYLRPDRQVGQLRQFNPWAERVLLD